MNSKKLDKSLLPQPERPMGWKNKQLQISTSEQGQLKLTDSASRIAFDQATTKKSSDLRPKGFQSLSNNNNQEPFTNSQPKQQPQRQSTNSRQSLTKPQINMTASQQSLQQKQLLTFAANLSNESQKDNRSRKSTQKERPNFLMGKESQYKKSGSRNEESQEISSSQQRKVDRSASKNKEHRVKLYRHGILRSEEFVAYSLVTKQSKSGMFSNDKLLVINSAKRQLMYFSTLPKLLPFASHAEMDRNFLGQQQPKQIIDLDRVRKFSFVPQKGNLAGVCVMYINEKGERKEWKLGMGSHDTMIQWVQLVNQVLKKQHYSVAKSQVKYPPKPKKQPQNKPNSYQTSFTKTLKQSVLPKIKQQQQLNESINLSSSSTPNKSTLSQQKRNYIVDQSKFVNTKNYVIDLQDVQNDDIFYVPEPAVEPIPSTLNQSMVQSRANPVNLINSDSNVLEPNATSRFTQQLEKKQMQVNEEHMRRMSGYREDRSQERQLIQPPPIVLNRKSSSTERLSQTTHKDLNVYIESNLITDDNEYEKQLKNKGNNSIKYNQAYSSKAYEQQPQQQYFTKQTPKAPLVTMPSTTPNISKKLFPTHTNPLHQSFRPYQQPSPQQPQQPQQPYSQPNQQRKRNNTQSTKRNNLQYMQQQMILSENDLFYKGNSRIHGEVQVQRKSDSDEDKFGGNNKKELIKKNRTEIQDLMLNNNLNNSLTSSYILNFQPSSLNNNWLLLWLSSQPESRIHIYTSFIKSCQLLAKKIIEHPSCYITNCSLSDNRTHLTFSLSNIELTFPLKLPLPCGLGEFISIIDFIRSEEFLLGVFRYERELQAEFRNYELMLKMMTEEFNNGKWSMPVVVPMCCVVEYMGVRVMCKAGGVGVQMERIEEDQIKQYQSQLEYVQEKCHAKLYHPTGTSNIKSNNPTTPQLQLYRLTLPTLSKTLLYINNLTTFLPLIPNPLTNTLTPTLQLPLQYIKTYVKTGVVAGQKDIEEIEKHLNGAVVKKAVEGLYDGEGEVVMQKAGLTKQFMGVVYGKVNEGAKEQLRGSSVSDRNGLVTDNISSTILTQIILTQYTKACHLYFLKQFTQTLQSCLSTSPQYSSVSTQPTTKPSTQSSTTFQKSVFQMLHYLLYKNSKVWTVLIGILQEKYKIKNLRKSLNNSMRETIDQLFKRINVEGLVSGFMNRLGVDCKVLQWDSSTTWSSFTLSQNTLSLTPYPKCTAYPLTIFLPQYQSMKTSLDQAVKSPNTAITTSLYTTLTAMLQLPEESFGPSHHCLIKSSEYELLEIAFIEERQLVDLVFGYFIPTPNKSNNKVEENLNEMGKRAVDLYGQMLDQQKARSSRDVSRLRFEISIVGVKWLIKQKQYQLAALIIQEQLQAIDIWTSPSQLIQTRLKLLDLASLFHHKKLANRHNLAIEYSLRSLQLCISSKSLLSLETCAQKSFQCANVHFECGQLEKALELYQLTEEMIQETERKVGSGGLSLEFLRIYVRKAGGLLALGRGKQALVECIVGLKKCEEFGVVGNSIQSEEREQLENIELELFELIARCYEVAKSSSQMKRIAQLCCGKFVQDKIMIMRGISRNAERNIEDSVNPQLMTRILKICWISILNQMTKNPQNSSLTPTNPQSSMNPSHRIKSYSLSLALSHTPPQLKPTPASDPFKHLSLLLDKLKALQSLYPRNRYDTETLAGFLCREIVEASGKANTLRSPEREQYGKRVRTMMSSRVEDVVNVKKQGGDGSVLYGMIEGVVRELTGQMGQQGEGQRGQMEHNYSTLENRLRKNSREKSNNSLVYTEKLYHTGTKQRQRSRSPHIPLPKPRQSQTSSIKQRLLRYFQQEEQQQPSILPFELQPQYHSQTQQLQPQLRNSFNSTSHHYRQIKSYNISELKDSMDKKYMLVEALFGLCGRQFVVGVLEEMVVKEQRKLKGNDQEDRSCDMFYD